MLVGSIIGVYLNNILPDIVNDFFMILLLFYVIYKVYNRALK